MNKKEYMQFSKRLVIYMLVVFVLCMICTFVCVSLFNDVASSFISIFTTTTTLTGSVFVGYLGKSGLENYNKIKNDFLKLSSADEQQEQQAG